MNDHPRRPIKINQFDRSRSYRTAACRNLAHGVSSTARAKQRPVPLLIERGEGAWIIDADGNRFIDYALGYGPLILGHSPQAVLDAVRADLDRGLVTASVHRGEAELAGFDRVDVAATHPLTEALLYRGVHTIPRGMMYLSTVHGEAEIDATLVALTGAMLAVRPARG